MKYVDNTSHYRHLLLKFTENIKIDFMVQKYLHD